MNGLDLVALDPLMLSRWQFGITTVYHFLFVPITIGTAFLVAGMQTAWVRTGKDKYLKATKFFGKLFLINFAMGVVTGIVQEFQFGMNWSEYSRFVADVFGAPLALGFGAIWFGAQIAMGAGRDLRAAIFDHVLSFSAREVNHFGAPSLLTRTTNDVQQIQQLVMMTAFMIVQAPIMMVGGVIMAVREDGTLSLMLLVSVPVLVIAISSIIVRMIPLFQVMQDRIDRINEVLREQITGMRVVRAFVRERYEEDRFGVANDEFGEEVKAVIEVAPGCEISDAEVRDWVAGTLAGFKVPKAVVTVTAVRRSAAGKADYRWAVDTVQKSSR